MKTHSYIPKKAKILEKRSLTQDTVSLRLAIKEKPFSSHPGQFVMLSVFGFGEVPIGITTAPNEEGWIEVAVRSAGMVTQKICSLSKGDEVGINGPFGNGFPISDLKNKDVVLIAGGLGLAPLRSLIHYYLQNQKIFKSLTILNGARDPQNLLYADEYDDWKKKINLHLTVDRCDRDWDGCVGMITKLYDQADIKRGSAIITCGPPVMFKSIIDHFAGKRVADRDMYFLLERRMKCGVGKCQHCTCGKYYVCLDGPVFSYEQLKYNKEAFK